MIPPGCAPAPPTDGEQLAEALPTSWIYLELEDRIRSLPHGGPGSAILVAPVLKQEVQKVSELVVFTKLLFSLNYPKLSYILDPQPVSRTFTA
jgi:hypothetical protein